MKILIDVRIIKEWQDYHVGQVVAVTHEEARYLEGQGVAVRVTKPQARRKPITAGHTVTKGA